jgi:hypothetical protein
MIRIAVTSLCEPCRDHIAKTGVIQLHPQPLSSLPADLMVIVACDKQRWWDIAWH